MIRQNRHTANYLLPKDVHIFKNQKGRYSTLLSDPPYNCQKCQEEKEARTAKSDLKPKLLSCWTGIKYSDIII
jgi:hypothetical protein